MHEWHDSFGEAWSEGIKFSNAINSALNAATLTDFGQYIMQKSDVCELHECKANYISPVSHTVN